MLDRLDIALILSPHIEGLMGAAVFSLITKLSLKKKFFKENNDRTVHGKYVSTPSGIGIFFVLMIDLNLGPIVIQRFNEKFILE